MILVLAFFGSLIPGIIVFIRFVRKRRNDPKYTELA